MNSFQMMKLLIVLLYYELQTRPDSFGKIFLFVANAAYRGHVIRFIIAVRDIRSHNLADKSNVLQSKCRFPLKLSQ